ncbi:MAG: hypothetical protein ACLFPE_00155 [Bacteroidales bacterium]
MSFLEKKIKDNPEFFDNRNLPEGHRGRFLGKLDQLEVEREKEVKSARPFTIFKIAAIALVFITASYLVFRFSISDISGAVMREVTRITLSDELENVFAYYDAVSSSKVEQIDEVAINPEEANRVKMIANKQLEKIDANLAEIEKEYAKHPDNKMLKAALVNNKRKKAEIMDQILEQLNQASSNLDENQMMNP